MKSQKQFYRSGNQILIGKILNQSHNSLANNYNVTNEIDFIGKWIIEGQLNGFFHEFGGFGGCTINLIDKKIKKKCFGSEIFPIFTKNTIIM